MGHEADTSQLPIDEACLSVGEARGLDLRQGHGRSEAAGDESRAVAVVVAETVDIDAIAGR